MPIHTAGRPSDAGKDHAHIVRFYDDDTPLLNEVADFMNAALDAGGATLVIATPVHARVLRARCAAGRAAARMVFLDAETTLEGLMADGLPDAARVAASVGGVVAEACAAGGPVHVFGEMVALLCERGQHDAAIALERLWNGLAAALDFSLFCAYPWRVFPDAEHAVAFEHICEEHHHAATQAADGIAHDVKGKSFDIARLEHGALALAAEAARRKDAERTLRQREQELADFVENAAEGLHRIGPDGIILWANKAELQMLGYRWEEYVGRHIAEFHVDTDVVQDILDTLLSGGALIDRPTRMRCKDGSIKHVLIHSNACFENGRLRYTRCFTRDATERHERDQALAQLAADSRAKDEFLGMLGHELRNPLAPIVAALQLMRLRGDSAGVRERGIIQRQVDHMVRVVDDLLEVPRVTRDTIELQVQQVEMAQVLGKAVEMVGTLLERRRHTLNVEIEPALACEGDPVRLAQAVADLLTNAARYTERGGEIRLHARSEGADGLRISVADNGVGLSADMVGRVSDRAAGARGRGLALVRTIVELHGGSLEARSEGKGRGSEFVVRLPLCARG